MKARLIAAVVDLLLDWISLLIRDDTPGTVAATFQELAQLLSGDIHVANDHSNPKHESAGWAHSDCADSRLFDTLRGASQNQLISLSKSGLPQISTVICQIDIESRGNNG